MANLISSKGESIQKQAASRRFCPIGYKARWQVNQNPYDQRGGPIHWIFVDFVFRGMSAASQVFLNYSWVNDSGASQQGLDGMTRLVNFPSRFSPKKKVFGGNLVSGKFTVQLPGSRAFSLKPVVFDITVVDTVSGAMYIDRFTIQHGRSVKRDWDNPTCI